jgi:magnesium-transporting ATPase (P-type)
MLCRLAMVTVRFVTGDSLLTAKAIAEYNVLSSPEDVEGC